jgi:hypothetical protein
LVFPYLHRLQHDEALHDPCTSFAMSRETHGKISTLSKMREDHMTSKNKSLVSRTLVRAPNPLLAIGQLGGHVKRGLEHPRGKRTGKSMALVSALPFADGDDRMILTFLDRSDPAESFDYAPHKGDNAVLIVPKADVHLSIVNGVCPGDVKGMKVLYDKTIIEPHDLDVDQTGLDVAASDRWVDMVDELGCDCTKVGGYPLWANEPVDVDKLTGKNLVFHHRLTADLVDFKLGDGGVIYVFATADGSSGAVCWQQAKY